MNQQHKNPRHRLYTLLALGKKDLHMDEESYRSFLLNHGAGLTEGKVSAKTMRIDQLEMAIETMKQRGFTVRSRAKFEKNWRKPRIDKITALWCALADAGVVRNRSYEAMARWCAIHTNTAKLEWASSQGLNQCIEALKSWCYRERVVID